MGARRLRRDGRIMATLTGPAIGPEAMLATMVIPNNAFKPDATSLEVLLGAHYNIAKQVQIGLGGGVGLLRQPGTPDFRMLFRLAYAPIRTIVHDRDKDGVPDGEDACPDEPGVRTANPQTNGCPADRDGDCGFTFRANGTVAA